jgi:hypothetical protein
MDAGFLLENKLRNEWSAPEFAQYLNASRLEYACKELATLDSGIKMRLLLSLLSLPMPRLHALWTNIEGILGVAASDRDEWVRVVLALVRRRLPSKADIGVPNDPTSLTSAATLSKGSPEAAAAAAAAAASEQDEEGAEGDFFLQSVREVISKLLPVAAGPGEPDAKEVLSPEFVPLEWPYLCQQVFPPSVEVDNVNRHFTPVEPEGAAAVGAAAAAPAPAPATAATAAAAQLATNASLFAAAAAADFKRKASPEPAASPLGSPSPPAFGSPSADFGSPPAESNVPASVLGILRDPANDKLTDEGRATVHEFYRSLDAPGRPTTGSTMVLLAEQREFCDDNTAIAVTQTQLKLDYAQNAAARVKTKKKYKLKGE